MNNEKKYRPLKIPMGMLEINEEAKKRKEEYINLWNLMDDKDLIEDNIGRYRTHYSNSLYVTYYLVRTFPFAYDRIELQGKNFDDPNRLFNDFENSFLCASTHKSDLRELVPEIYYFPELFINDFDFGNVINDSNETIRVQNVLLPKWCNNNQFKFVCYLRKFLESKEISLRINNWFDLIFGVYQKGDKAKERIIYFLLILMKNF